MNQKIEWHLNRDSGNWRATIGGWRACVLRMTSTGEWYPYVERIALPHDRRDGPHTSGAGAARAWCEEELIRVGVLAPPE